MADKPYKPKWRDKPDDGRIADLWADESGVNVPPADLKGKEIRTLRHPLLKGRPKGFWYPDLVGKIPGYPKTHEAYLRRQAECRAQMVRLNAAGVTNSGARVPDGWAGRQIELRAARVVAKQDAERVYQAMVEKALVEVPADQSDAALAKLAVEGIVRIAVDPSVNDNTRLSAWKSIMEFTKIKPSTKSEVTVATAEDFLLGLIQK